VLHQSTCSGTQLLWENTPQRAAHKLPTNFSPKLHHSKN